MIGRLIKLYFSTVKILTQRPTHISVVTTVLLITKTFVVRCDRKIKTNAASIITHIKHTAAKTKRIKMRNNWGGGGGGIYVKGKQNILGKGRDKIKLKKTSTTTTKKRILNTKKKQNKKLKTKQNNNNYNKNM